MSTNLTVQDHAVQIERVLIEGNLSTLKPEERVSYYRMVCESVGLNPLTKPFEYITLNGRLTLYARKDATDQLRNIHNVSVNIVAREYTEGCYVVTSRAKLPNGREDESIGAVPIENLKGEARANAMMKCETKSKRRVTLSICGLGILDETEIETITSAKPEVQRITEDIPLPKPANNGSAAANNSQAVKSSKGPEPTHAADKDSTAATANSVADSSPVTETATAVEYCTKEQQDWLRLSFKDALPAKYSATAEKIRKDWLQHAGYTNARGDGTSTMIPRAKFKEEAKACIRFARELAE